MSTTNDGRIVSLQVGRVRAHDWPAVSDRAERPWRTAYFKDPVVGPKRLGPLGLDGDEQFDRNSHGGTYRAVLAYSAEHYPRWRLELGIPEMGPGGFGENLTVSGQDESNVCVGDVFAIGSARLQVTQPRGPCANIARRWQRPELVKRVVETSRFGWYLRVLEQGDVAAGMDVRLVERPYADWNAAHVFRLRANPKLDPGAVSGLARCPELTPALRERFAAQLATLDGR